LGGGAVEAVHSGGRVGGCAGADGGGRRKKNGHTPRDIIGAPAAATRRLPFGDAPRRPAADAPPMSAARGGGGGAAAATTQAASEEKGDLGCR